VGELRRPSLRLVVGLAVLVLGIVEVQALVQTVSTQTRLRERVLLGIRTSLLAAHPRIGTAFLPGGAGARRRALQEAAQSTLAAEAEVFELSGRRLEARPGSSPVEHWPSAEELEAVQSGHIVTLGPVVGAAPRVLVYAAFPSGKQTLLLRLSVPVPELVEDLRERRQLLIGHAISLLILALAAALALFPTAGEGASAPPRALDAYAEAMGRLRDRGEALSREHQVELRRMEDEIHDKEAMARAGELAAGMVHEVRNGLGTIVGYARLAEAKAGSADAVDAARGILAECETLELVIRRLMDYVRRETLDLAPFDPLRMLSRVAAREGRGPGAEVKPPAGDHGTLTGDEELLERAFENIVRNAREAAGAGGHVWIGAAREGECLQITVADDGPGLAPELRDGLRPFRSTKAGGLGLGLPIALKIVRLHGGELLLGERVPRGLEVRVRLPSAGPSQ